MDRIIFIIDEQTKQAAQNLIRNLPFGGLDVVIRPHKELRTYLQNRLSHVWYSNLAQFDDSDNATGWKCYCKLHHGVGIMRRDDTEFRTVYDEVIKGLTYEKKLHIMKILPVTSLMNTAQLNEYLEAVQVDFRDKGINLMFPDDYPQ